MQAEVRKSTVSGVIRQKTAHAVFFIYLFVSHFYMVK